METRAGYAGVRCQRGCVCWASARPAHLYSSSHRAPTASSAAAVLPAYARRVCQRWQHMLSAEHREPFQWQKHPRYAAMPPN